MKLSHSTIRNLEHLLTIGEIPTADISPLKIGQNLGMWTTSTDGSRIIATPATVQLLQTLPNLSETVAALLSCEADIRQAWGKIIAARLQELGTRRDAQGLSEAINTLGQASETLIQLLPQAALSSSNYTELERTLFDAPAEQAPAAPKLLRVLGATAPLVEGKQGTPANPLQDIDSLNPAINWVRGRLLRLPSLRDGQIKLKSSIKSSVLSGDWGDLTPEEINPDDTLSQGTMRWVLYRPWAFLLAQVVFTQEAWSAERVSGKLSLELEDSQLAQFDQPTQVLVVITTAAGEEVICGTLAELLLQVLSQLGVSLLTAHSPQDTLYITSLQERLAPVIAVLLKQQVWRFETGSSGRRSGYTIHSNFSDSCYRVLGSKSFNRLGNSITSAIRNSCDRWVKERLATAGNTSVAQVTTR